MARGNRHLDDQNGVRKGMARKADCIKRAAMREVYALTDHLLRAQGDDFIVLAVKRQGACLDTRDVRVLVQDVQVVKGCHAVNARV